MTKKKKITVEDRFKDMEHAIGSINLILKTYVEYKGDLIGFKQFLDMKAESYKKARNESKEQIEIMIYVLYIVAFVLGFILGYLLGSESR